MKSVYWQYTDFINNNFNDIVLPLGSHTEEYEDTFVSSGPLVKLLFGDDDNIWRKYRRKLQMISQLRRYIQSNLILSWSCREQFFEKWLSKRFCEMYVKTVVILFFFNSFLLNREIQSWHGGSVTRVIYEIGSLNAKPPFP